MDLYLALLLALPGSAQGDLGQKVSFETEPDKTGKGPKAVKIELA